LSKMTVTQTTLWKDYRSFKMRKIALILAFAVVAVSAVLAQETVYVSAKGSKNNSGRSEAEPMDFDSALTKVFFGESKKIIIIGTLDIKSNGMKDNSDFLFFIQDLMAALGIRGTALGEIVITGKPGAPENERAVLSAKGSGKYAVRVRNCKIRFEHIEISGGEGEYGYGLYICNDAQVTLGPGVVVRNNDSAGIFVDASGTCIIDGGEIKNSGTGAYVEGVLILRNGSIRDNSSDKAGGGVFVSGGGQFTMSGGSITGNRTALSGDYVGGGVAIDKDGRFTMTGGSITNNRSHGEGGGVYVASGGRFDQNGGIVSGNTIIEGGYTSNVYRAGGSLGSSSTGGSSSSSSSSSNSSSSGNSDSSSKSSFKFSWNIPVFLGFYLQGWHQNTFSGGLPLQVGVEFNFGKVISLALLGEADGGLGYPNLLEGNLGGMAELYFMNKTIGVGAGFGSSTVFLPISSLFSADNSSEGFTSSNKTTYMRFALILRKDSKTSFFAQHYANGDWGFGVQFGWDLFD